MNNDDFDQFLGEKLKQWDEPLSPDLEGRLRAARRTALESNTSASPIKYLIPGLALGCVAAISFVTLNKQIPNPSLSPIDDMYMLTSGDDFELYDDVEFLLWLGEQSDAEVG